jgi:hypothetical protein
VFEQRLKRAEDVRVTRRRPPPRTQTQERVRLRREANTVARDPAPRDPQRDFEH